MENNAQLVLLTLSTHSKKIKTKKLKIEKNHAHLQDKIGFPDFLAKFNLTIESLETRVENAFNFPHIPHNSTNSQLHIRPFKNQMDIHVIAFKE